MTRINVFRKTAAPRDSVAWGKDSNTRNIATAALGNLNALAFGAILIICSVAVGCSSDNPKPVSSNNQIPVTQPQSQPQMQPMPVPVAQPVSKPAPKKSAPKKPATVNYTDKTYGVTFEYPRRYAIETGDAAAELLLTNPIPMNFVQPGGVALAAVELPETGFVNTDFSSAFFDVSVHKTLTADQCNDFSVPQSKSIAKTEPAPASTEVAKQQLVAYLNTYRWMQPRLSGHDLHAMGLTPGPRFRQVLDRLLEARLNGEVTTDTEERALVQRLIRTGTGQRWTKLHPGE